MFEAIGEGHKIMHERQKKGRDPEELASICHMIDSHGVCPARDNPTLMCPLGDDGICENVTSKDWIFILQRFENAGTRP